MSKAFTKEDVEPPERSGRVRSASGLPPGALNYITAAGAKRLGEELVALREAAAGGMDETHQEQIAELERALSSATVIAPPEEAREEVLFGATVTLRAASGEVMRYRIVGVDETHLAPDQVSWISPIARALIGARVGDRVYLPELPTPGAVEVIVIAD